MAELVQIRIRTPAGETSFLTRTLGSHTLGSSAESSIRIDHDSVSSGHARLTFDSEGFHVEDLFSANGTFQAGTRLDEKTSLPYTQSIRAGAVEIEIERLVETRDSLGPTLPTPGPSGEEVLAVGAPNDSVKYRIGAPIAEGGMGMVIEADDPGLERTVAMKTMLADMADMADMAGSQDARARFVREARVLARLEHPNIVPVHEIGHDAQGQPFYTMKRVRGVTLRDVLRRLKEGDPETVNQYPLTVLLTVFQKVCDAMAHAHFHGIIHRDLKPENIMLGEFGEVLVMDWGLAKNLTRSDEEAVSPERQAGDASSTLSAESAVTMDGSMMGTPQFMAPEQAEGRVANHDARTDVFSLGAILYNILALRPPIEGKSVQDIVTRLTAGEIEAPTSSSVLQTAGADSASLPIRLAHCLQGRVPEALSAVTMKALALRQEDRYQTVEELQVDIAKFQGGFATSAEDITAWKQIKLLILRHKVVSALTGLVAFLILGSLVLLKASEKKAMEAAVLAEEKEKEATLNAQEARANAGLAKANAEAADAAKQLAEKRAAAVAHELYFSSVARANIAFNQADLLAARQLLALAPPEFREWEWFLLDYLTDDRPRLLHGSRDAQRHVFSADGAQIAACHAETGWIYVWDAKKGRLSHEFQTPAQKATSVVFNPDSDHLACASEDKILIYHIPTESLIAALEGHADQLNPKLDWSPDGRWIASCSRDQTVRVWNAKTRQLHQTLTGHQGDITGVAFSHDSGTLVSCDEVNQALVWRVEDGARLRDISRRGKPMPPNFHDVIFLPQPNTIALRHQGGITVWDVQTGEVQQGHQLRGGITFVDAPRQIDRVAISGGGATSGSVMPTPGRPCIRVCIIRTRPSATSALMDPVFSVCDAAGYR